MSFAQPYPQTPFSHNVIRFVWPSPEGASAYRLPPSARALCQAIRLGAIALIVWRFYLEARYPFQTDLVIAQLKLYQNLDVAGFSEAQRFGLLALTLLVLSGLQAGIYVSLFQLFTGLLRGEAFSPATGVRLRRAGLFDLAFIVAGPLRHVFAVALLTAHLPGGSHWIWPVADMAPLYDFVVGGAGVALGHVLKVAADIARENSEIV